MSDRNIAEAEESILSKGPRYATTPKVNPIDLAAPVEDALQHSIASEQAKEAARIKICETIRKAARPPSNVSREEKKAWKEDQTIKILQVDKGNTTVVMNMTEYDKKLHNILDHQNCYCKLKRDPTQGPERSLPSKLLSLKRESKIIDCA